MIHMHGLNQLRFLNENWEKKFFHLPEAFKIEGNEISENDILDMINDEYFETRLIQNNNLKEGPLNLNSLNELKDVWTLFLHNFNHYNQFAKNLEKSVEFIPKWIFDDVLLSASNKGSSMSAHIDNYNVFIVQVKGKRRWRIQENPVKTFQEGKDLKILKEFKHDHEVILEPGDVLFIPPHVAHEAYSLEDSYSCSIGFKSLEEQDLMDSFLLEAMKQNTNEGFHSLKLAQRHSPHLISDEEINLLSESIIDKISNKNSIRKWLLNYLAKPKKSSEDTIDEISKEEFNKQLELSPVSFDEFVNLVVYKDKDHYLCQLNEWRGKLNEEKFKELDKLILNKERLHHIQKSSPITDELYELYKLNYLFFNSED